MGIGQAVKEESMLHKSILQRARWFWRHMRSIIDGRSNRKRLRMLLEPVSPGVSPRDAFSEVSDDYWLWMHTEGYRKSPQLRELLPGLPAESIQRGFTGSAGDTTLREGFVAYALFKRLAEECLEGRELHTVLDFGCGWGRTIRFFLKDVEASELWGVDCHPLAIETCRQTNRWCRFELVDPLPPSNLPANTFDLIYCYSVFSHLSEEAHDQWLREFKRILGPGGVLIATTWPRQFILRCAELRSQETRAAWQWSAARAFPDTEAALASYDGGGYVHTPTGANNEVLTSAFFGETCIPQRYVETHWTECFDFVDFIDDRSRCPQNVIVVRKGAPAAAFGERGDA